MSTVKYATTKGTKTGYKGKYTGYKKRTTVATQVKKILNDPKNVEYKSKDVSLASLTESSTFTVTLLNGMALGDTGIGDREGKDIVIKSIQLQGSLNCEAGGMLCRYLLVYDKQPNGVALTAADVLVSNDINALKNLSNKHRFIILKDKMFSVQSNTIDVNTGNHMWIPKYYKKHNLAVGYNAGNAGTIADINTGSLYLLTAGRAETPAACEPNMVLNTRIRYIDR